jgi:hypothetical protein
MKTIPLTPEEGTLYLCNANIEMENFQNSTLLWGENIQDLFTRTNSTAYKPITKTCILADCY